MEYIVVVQNTASAVALMEQYVPNVVSVHTEPGYIIYVWHDATADQINLVNDQATTISTVYING